MRHLFILVLCILSIQVNCQVFEITDVYICKKEREIKRIQKRFDRAVIGKDYFGEPGNFYMELEEDDVDEYFEFLGIKFYCIPKGKRKNIQLIMLFYDENEWNDNKPLFDEKEKDEEPISSDSISI